MWWLLIDVLLRDLPDSVTDVLAGLAVAGLFLIATAVCIAGIYVLMGMIRFAWMLNGTWLGMRHVVRTAWVDLATAEIDTGYDKRTGDQRLVARSRDGVVIRLSVTNDKGVAGTLPADDLVELADAITRGRVRSGEPDRALVIADRLRQLAVDPATDVHVPEPGTQDGTDKRESESADEAPIPAEVHTARYVWMRTAQLAGVLVVLLGALLGLGYLFGFEGLAWRICIAIALFTVLYWPIAVKQARRKQLRQAGSAGEPTEHGPR